jgi:hypothetical protein
MGQKEFERNGKKALRKQMQDDTIDTDWPNNERVSS